jgi:hypothetical protein
MIPADITERLQFFADPRFRFDPEPHEYWLGERRLTNFSTWIEDYKKPFDRAGIAASTAAYRGCSAEDVLAEWDRSAWVGTKTHEFIEAYYQHAGVGELPRPHDDAEVQLRCRKFLEVHAFRLSEFLPVAQELSLFHEASGLCGTLDFLGWHMPTQALFVLDWKTNKAINTNASRSGRTMLGPFADLDECELNTYSLQNSLYRLLLEEAGIPTVGGAIVHLPPGQLPSQVYRATDYRARLRTLLF